MHDGSRKSSGLERMCIKNAVHTDRDCLSSLQSPGRSCGTSMDAQNDFHRGVESSGSPRDAPRTTECPAWARLRQQMTNAFPCYYANPKDPFRSEVTHALALLDELKHNKPDCPIFYGNPLEFASHVTTTAATIAENTTPLDTVVSKLVALFDGMNNTAHPHFQFNVIPHPNKAAIIAALLANCTSQNFIAGHSAWNTIRAENESIAMITRLIDAWDPAHSGGIFTYGGAGCYLYGIKYALNSVMSNRDIRTNGLYSTRAIIICSQQGHYASKITADWLGLGTESVVEVATTEPYNEMDMYDLEARLQACQRDHIPVVSIVCTMGTTDAMAIDPVDKVAALVEKYPNPSGFNKPLIYCDSVSGWAFLSFRGYDFEANPLQFSHDVNNALRVTYEKMSTIQHADAIAIDFHKTGWAPYTTSLFMVRDFAHFESTMSRTKSAYIHNRTPYNPGLYSLEVSRSAAPALAAWATLNYFGLAGFRVILGGVVEMSRYLRSIIKSEPSITCCNAADCGLVTVFRVYPEGIDAERQYAKEMSDASEKTRAELDRHNALQKDLADEIWQFVRSGQKIDGLYAPCCNYSSGFRKTQYPDGEVKVTQSEIYALKSFPMNVNVTKEHMNHLIQILKFLTRRVCTR